ncbi:uncharacterized protein LOC131620060 [Vicia villosa]|uniref:uncharacterized protein LOC131620060 n=1 Tax=Vicia villosa TaxID=3911 RepID=UPI00273C7009|nr:uncharacterized protein LOC131620060 [Vicia villosa]
MPIEAEGMNVVRDEETVVRDKDDITHDEEELMSKMYEEVVGQDEANVVRDEENVVREEGNVFMDEENLVRDEENLVREEGTVANVVRDEDNVGEVNDGSTTDTGDDSANENYGSAMEVGFDGFDDLEEEDLDDLLEDLEGEQSKQQLDNDGLEEEIVNDSEELESGCDSEDGDVRKKSYPMFNMKKDMADYKWEVGVYFRSKDDFKEAITSYVVQSGRNMRFIKNGKVRVRVKCKEGFQWEAYYAKLPNEETWQLSKLVDKHECSREYNVKMLTTKWLSKRIQNSLKNNPRMKIKDIKAKAQRKWNVGVNKTKAIRARFKARDMVDGSFLGDYTRIYDYCHELLRVNPGSTIKINVDPVPEGNEDQKPYFKRLYVCFAPCKESFKLSRHIIGLNGCFLKGLCGGQILAAIGRDPNDQMLPVAFAVGLLPAMDELLPGVEQRFCVRHLYNNFRKKYPGKMLKDAIWKAARSTYVQAWEREMRSMRLISDEAYLHMMKTSPRFWSKSHFKVTNKCDTLLNNMSKAFNNVILESRMSDEHIFEVKHVQDPTDMFTVNLKDHICSCRKWELSGLPCVHALSCMKSRNFKFEDFVPEYYRKSRYIVLYKPVIYPVNGSNLWARTQYPDVHPPKYRKMPRRPKKKRNLEQGELDGTDKKIRRTGLIVKCSRCKKSWHNKATCKVTGPAQPTSQQTSQQTPQGPAQPSTQQTSQLTTSQPATQQVTSQPATQQRQAISHAAQQSQPASQTSRTR